MQRRNHPPRARSRLSRVGTAIALTGLVVAFGGESQAGKVLCTWSKTGSNVYANSGVVNLGDWNGDGVLDVAIADADDSTLFPFGGAVRVYDSGTCGTVLFAAFGQAANEAYGEPMGPGDLDGDGLAELVAMSLLDSTLVQAGGRIDVYKGGSGALLYSYHGAWQTQGLGWDHAVLGDVDLDGVSDFAVSAPTAGSLTGPNPLPGHVLVFSGATGQVLYDLWGAPGQLQLGWSLAAAGDADQDGRADLAVGTPTTNVPVLNGEVQVFSGATGTPLWTMVGAPGQDLGFSIHAVQDVDGDGAWELAVTDGEANLLLVSADTGQVDESWPTLGGSVRGVAGPGDVTGDGRADMIVPVIHSFHSQLLRGGDFQPLARLDTGFPTGDADVDQDGFGDYSLVLQTLPEATARLYSGRCDGVDPFGDGCPGSSGEAPQLLVLGPCDLRPNVTLTLVVQNATPNQAAVLVFGQGPANLPVGSCVLHVAPPLGPVVALPIDGNGDGFVNVPIPPGLSGLQAHLQAFVGDAQAPGGFAGSNGLTLRFP